MSTDRKETELWASQEVCEALGWTRTTLKRARESKGFPDPIAIVAGGRIAVWDGREVRAWQEAQQ